MLRPLNRDFRSLRLALRVFIRLGGVDIANLRIVSEHSCVDSTTTPNGGNTTTATVFLHNKHLLQNAFDNGDSLSSYVLSLWVLDLRVVCVHAYLMWWGTVCKGFSCGLREVLGERRLGSLCIKFGLGGLLTQGVQRLLVFNDLRHLSQMLFGLLDRSSQEYFVCLWISELYLLLFSILALNIFVYSLFFVLAVIFDVFLFNIWVSHHLLSFSYHRHPSSMLSFAYLL